MEEIEIFCCYSRDDARYFDILLKHLNTIDRRIVQIWHDKKIQPGEQWEDEIKKHLDTADIVLFLASANFIASEYCYHQEMQYAMQRQERNEVRVIPIILSHVSLKDTPFRHLQALPQGAKPITEWESLDKAFTDVVAGIRSIALPLFIKRSLAKAAMEYEQCHYKEALLTYRQILDFDQDRAEAHRGKGRALEELGSYQEARRAYDQAIRLQPDKASYYRDKSNLLQKQNYYKEALDTLTTAIEHVQDFDQIHIERGDIFYRLRKYEEALKDYDMAIKINEYVDPEVYYKKAITLDEIASQAHRAARQRGYVEKGQDPLEHLRNAFEKLASEMIGEFTVSDLVKTIIERITKALGAKASSLYLIDPGTRILRVQAATGYHEVLYEKGATYNLDDDEGITAWIANSGKKFTARTLAELHGHEHWRGRYREMQEGREPDAFLGIPLKFRTRDEDKVIGVLKIEDIHPHPGHPETYFTDQDILLGEIMGSMITTVIQNTRLTDRRLRDLNEGLKKLSEAMVGELDMQKLLDNIVERIKEVLRADAASLFLIEPGTRILKVQAATGYQRALRTEKAQYDIQEKGITSFIARNSMIVTARSKEELRNHKCHKGKYTNIQEGREPNAFLGIPLKVSVNGGGHETIGVLKIEDIHPDERHPENYFTDQDIILVEMMGSFITTVIQNMRQADRPHSL